MGNAAAEIARWLRQRIGPHGPRGFVVGLSGGIDSAVVLRLCQMAAPEHVVAVIMPCHGDPRDERDARLVADHFRVPAATVDLSAPYDALLDAAAHALTTLHPKPEAGPPPEADIKAQVPAANLKPRLRMATLYYVANSLGYLVVGTGNRSELSIGYFTKYGDGGVDLLPIGHLLKSEVRRLASELGVPQPIIDKPPSAGLWLGQTDEAEMGFTYADLEDYLTRGRSAVGEAIAARLDRMVGASEHKRTTPPLPQMP